MTKFNTVNQTVATVVEAARKIEVSTIGTLGTVASQFAAIKEVRFEEEITGGDYEIVVYYATNKSIPQLHTDAIIVCVRNEAQYEEEMVVAVINKEDFRGFKAKEVASKARMKWAKKVVKQTEEKASSDFILTTREAEVSQKSGETTMKTDIEIIRKINLSTEDKQSIQVVSSALRTAKQGGVVFLKTSFGEFKTTAADVVADVKGGEVIAKSLEVYFSKVNGQLPADAENFGKIFNVSQSFKLATWAIATRENMNTLLSRCFLTVTHTAKESVNGKELTRKTIYGVRITNGNLLLAALVSLAKDAHAKDNFKAMQERAGLQYFIPTNLEVNSTLFAGMQSDVAEDVATREAICFDKEILFKLKEYFRGEETISAFLVNTSADISHKLMNRNLVTWEHESSMVASYLGDTVLSVYDAKKAIARMVLETNRGNKVSIGKRRLAVLTTVTNVDGSAVAPEVAMNNKLLAAFAGGMSQATKELVQQYGFFRFVSKHHAKGVAYNSGSSVVDGILSALGAEVVVPMFKSGMVGLAHAVLETQGKEVDINEFIVNISKDEELVSDLNKMIQDNLEYIEINGLKYGFSCVEEELFVSDFYSLQGYVRNQGVETLKEKIDAPIVNGSDTVDTEEFDFFQGFVTETEEEAVEEEETTLIRELLAPVVAGDMTYSPVVALKALIDNGEVVKANKKGFGGLLVAHQIEAQFGKEALETYLHAAMDNNALVQLPNLKAGSRLAKFDEAQTKRVMDQVFTSALRRLFINNGTVSSVCVSLKKEDRGNVSIAEAMNQFINNLYYGVGSWTGLFNLEEGFALTFKGREYVFPGSQYWNDVNRVIVDSEGVKKFLGGDMFKTFASIAMMIRNEAFAKDEHKTFAKHTLALEELFVANEAFQFELVNSRNLVTVFQLEDNFTVWCNDRKVAKVIKNNGAVGFIKFPVLMENNVRKLAAKAKSVMSYESQAEKELNAIVEASAIYVDPIVHILNQDDTDGDRATVFEMVGMNNQPNFTLESVKESVSWGTQYAYLLDEVNGVVNTKWINSESVKSYSRDDFQDAVKVIALAKEMTGKHTNALIVAIPFLKGLVGKKTFNGKVLTEETVNDIIAAYGLAVQSDAVTNMKHSKGEVNVVENVYMMGEAQHGEQINRVEAWKALIMKGDFELSRASDLAELIASNIYAMADTYGLSRIGQVNHYNGEGYDVHTDSFNLFNIVNVNQRSFWNKIHSATFATRMNGNLVSYVERNAMVNVFGKMLAKVKPAQFAKAPIGAMGSILKVAAEKALVEASIVKAMASAKKEEVAVEVVVAETL